jgi:hypothetical protein
MWCTILSRNMPPFVRVSMTAWHNCWSFKPTQAMRAFGEGSRYSLEPGGPWTISAFVS